MKTYYLLTGKCLMSVTIYGGITCNDRTLALHKNLPTIDCSLIPCRVQYVVASYILLCAKGFGIQGND